MKRFLAILTVLCLVLSCGTAAFAEVEVNGESKGSGEVTHSGDAQYVSADASGDDLTVNGDVTGDQTGVYNSVSASDGATITVNGTGEEPAVSENYNRNAIIIGGGATVMVDGDVTENGDGNAVHAIENATVTVEGDVTEEGDGNAIDAGIDAIVTVEGNVTEKGEGDAVYAYDDATVEVKGDVTEEGDGNAINAADEETTVKVTGNVTEKDDGDAVVAAPEATVTVGGSVTETGDGNAVVAAPGTTVTVGGNVTETGEGSAITAFNGSAVSVSGNVSENGEIAIVSFKSRIEVGGNVTTGDTGVAVQASAGSDISVAGNVVTGAEKDQIVSIAVNAEDKSSVTVGGNVTAGDGGVAVMLNSDAVALIEGKVTGDINIQETVGNGQLYLGQLTGNITEESDKSHIHYLINTDTGSAALNQFRVTGDTSVIASDTIDGVNKTDYRYTTTADTAVLSGKSFTLKPTDSGKKLKSVSGFSSADVTMITNGDGSVTLTLGNNFTGGLQSLMLVLENIAHDNPGVAADILAHLDSNVTPAVFVDPSYTVATATVELPEGAEEGSVVPLNIPNHAGVKIAASMLNKTAEYHQVQLFLNGVQIPMDSYTVTVNGDGSITVQLSNTYLLALGNGTHSFLLLADGTEIRFSSLVAK